MKKHEIKVGEHYIARVNGKYVTVRVDAVRQVGGSAKRNGANPASTRYDVTSLNTGRRTTFHSAAKFRSHVAEPKQLTTEGKQCADPTSVLSAEDGQETAPVFFPGSLLSKLKDASTNNVVSGYTPTAEQAAILETARQSGLRVLVIAAGAGAGKTSTLKMLEAILPGEGQYTAFNSPLVAESKQKFVKARCNTTHSLAFGSVGRLYAHRLGGNRIYSAQIANMLGIVPTTVLIPNGTTNESGEPGVTEKTLQAGYLASQVMKAIRKFCQSADREITQRHFELMPGVDAPGKYDNQNAVVEMLIPYAEKAWADLSDVNGKLPFSHDCYVKIWQLGEGENAPVISADYILLDEAQDSAPVFLDVLRRQSALIILVGDDNQRIYEWRGAVNAMAAFPGAPRRLLSQSFRFGQAIADVANSILDGLNEPTDLVMRGCDIPSVVILPDTYDNYPCRAVLCRTNACAIATVLQAKKDGRNPHLIGGGAETVRFVQAAQDLQRGRGTSHPDLCLFTSWREVQAYVKEDEGSDLKLMVKLIDEFKCEPILNALLKMPDEENADLVVSTAHKSKGREWSSVRLAGDFPPANRMNDPDRRLLYVAATRAQHVLDLSQCPPFVPGCVDPETGKEVKPITVRFTSPTPTLDQLENYLAEKAVRSNAGSRNEETEETEEVEEQEEEGQEVVFSWRKWENSWCVQGPVGYEPGCEVTVEKRNGQRTQETIEEVVKEFSDVCLYSIQH